MKPFITFHSTFLQTGPAALFHRALLGICLIFSPLLLATHAMGATIIWDPVATSFNDNDSQVINTGTTVAAFTIYGTSTTTLSINGVTFQNYKAATPSNFVFNEYVGAQNSGDDIPINDYGRLVHTATFVFDGDAATGNYGIVLQNLNIGQTYTVQAWTPYFGTSAFATRFSSSVPNSAGNATPQSPTLALGNDGTPPQFAIGTFTANATTQNVYYYGNSDAGIIGAFQVRTVAVPEPQTLALAVLGASTVLFRLRRKRHVA